MANIASNTIYQGSHTFNLGLPFVIQGYSEAEYHNPATPDTWEVRIVTPEGVMLVKTSGITFPVPTSPVIFFPIVSGDLDKAGDYTYQVTKTTAGAKIKSEVATFVVEESVPSLAF
jgi:hypothetical protein